MSMLQRSVLTELAVHEMLNAAPPHEGRKHLLTIIDCLMFPPFDVMRGRVEFDGLSVVEGGPNKDSSAMVSVDGAWRAGEMVASAWVGRWLRWRGVQAKSSSSRSTRSTTASR